MNADEHGLSLDLNPIPGPPWAALDDNLQYLDGFMTEAAERNIFAKTTILHACSTEFTEGKDPDYGLHPLCVLCGLRGYV
jgi:hypothetical protein